MPLARHHSLKPRFYYCLQFFFSYIYYCGAHLPWGERTLGHVGRGVADGVVPYVALSRRRDAPGEWTYHASRPRCTRFPRMHPRPVRTFIEKEGERERYPTPRTRAPCRYGLVLDLAARDVSRVTYGTTRAVPDDTIPGPFITRLWSLSHDTCRLRKPVLHIAKINDIFIFAFERIYKYYYINKYNLVILLILIFFNKYNLLILSLFVFL